MSTAPHQPEPSEWLASNEIKAGYYWCRLGESDHAPAIVKIDDQQSPDELALWEFECGEWQPLKSYGPAWQFAALAAPLPAPAGEKDANE